MRGGLGSFLLYNEKARRAASPTPGDDTSAILEDLTSLRRRATKRRIQTDPHDDAHSVRTVADDNVVSEEKRIFFGVVRTIGSLEDEEPNAFIARADEDTPISETRIKTIRTPVRTIDDEEPNTFVARTDDDDASFGIRILPSARVSDLEPDEPNAFFAYVDDESSVIEVRAIANARVDRSIDDDGEIVFIAQVDDETIEPSARFVAPFRRNPSIDDEPVSATSVTEDESIASNERRSKARLADFVVDGEEPIAVVTAAPDDDSIENRRTNDRSRGPIDTTDDEVSAPIASAEDDDLERQRRASARRILEHVLDPDDVSPPPSPPPPPPPPPSPPSIIYAGVRRTTRAACFDPRTNAEILEDILECVELEHKKDPAASIDEIFKCVDIDCLDPYRAELLAEEARDLYKKKMEAKVDALNRELVLLRAERVRAQQKTWSLTPVVGLIAAGVVAVAIAKSIDRVLTDRDGDGGFETKPKRVHRKKRSNRRISATRKGRAPRH